MSYSSCDPSTKSRIIRWWKESPIRLLTGQQRLPIGRILALALLAISLTLLLITIVIDLAVLPVIHQKGQSRSQTDNDEGLQDALVELVVIIFVAAGKTMLRNGVVVVAIVVLSAVVVRVGVFKEGGKPIGEGPILFRFCTRKK